MEQPLASVLGRLDEQIKSGQRKKALRTVEEGDLSMLMAVFGACEAHYDVMI